MGGNTGALHEVLMRDEVVAGPTERRFGFTVAIGLSLIGLLSLWRHGPHFFYWFGGALVAALFAAAWPSALRPANKAWLKLGLLLNKVVSPVILGVMFYTVFTATGCFVRLLGRDPLGLERDAAAKSYWILRSPPGPAPDSLKHQF